jgi:predicted GNAT family N-acyltransferase
MQLVRLEPLSEQQWNALYDGERKPWGGCAVEGLRWREKTHTVGIRADDARLLAVAGSVRAGACVASADTFEVLGIGGLFVTRDARGRGFVAELLDGLLAHAGERKPDRAMLFCRPPLMAMYAKFDFREIADPVWAQQRAGPVRMPISAMWRPLRAGAVWPAGRVDVLGPPF